MVTVTPPVFKIIKAKICGECGGYYRGNWRSEVTNREREILALVAQGYSNKMVAEAFDLKTTTIKNHMTSIMRKLTARDRTNAVILGIEKGLIEKVESQ